MGDYTNRNRGNRGYNNRKRRYRDDDELEHRPQRRRYEEPPHVRLRRQLLGIAESAIKTPQEEAVSISESIAEHYEDEAFRNSLLSLSLQLVVEQPLKIPFIAAVVLATDPKKPEATTSILDRAGGYMQKALEAGSWRELKLLLRFLGCLQGILEGDGIFPLLDDLFNKALDLQTASSEDSLGLELVKVILLTIPYVLASSGTGLEQLAANLLEKTDVIASTPHALEAVVSHYPGDKELEHGSLISILQKQLQNESANNWALDCLPRPWSLLSSANGHDDTDTKTKHELPTITMPEILNPGPIPLFPELYFSVYGEQAVETVPPLTNIASLLLRDSLVDTINLLDFNRNATARFLIDVDSYFAPNTFVKRATQFDRLKELTGDQSTWKPEDVAVDAVFSQLFQLPSPEHRLVYYHSVLTETCKVAPAAIAPSLGRAIRFLYKHIDSMDMELEYRFMDWFAHHLSNFGFTWKWTEWVDDVELSDLHPKKAFMTGALEKEVRLSFANRIRDTLPQPYQALIPDSKDQDFPEFKFSNPETPFAEEGLAIKTLLQKKAPDEEIQVLIERINSIAASSNENPLLISTDAFVTSVCFIGAKSLSHVLSCIERCKERLLLLGSSPESREQTITSVMTYWRDQPGVGVNIVDKLLNYTILTPLSVVDWALKSSSPYFRRGNANSQSGQNGGSGGDDLDNGRSLALPHVYELVAATTRKVCARLRQIIAARDRPDLPADQVALLQSTLVTERAAQRDLFQAIEAALAVTQTKARALKEDASSRSDSDDASLVESWANRWLTVFRRKFAVEEAFIEQKDVANSVAVGNGASVTANGS